MTDRPTDTTAPPRRRRKNIGYSVLLAVCLVLLYLLVVRNMRFFLVPSSSMEPTLLPADYLLTLADDTYERGDVIVIDDPEEEGSHLVKRLIGLPGDVVSVFDGALFINGKYASEPYWKEPMDYSMESYTVPGHEIFVLGDNRNYSDDSHLWKDKSVDLATVVGRVRLVYLPFDRIHRVDRFPLTEVLRQ